MSSSGKSSSGGGAPSTMLVRPGGYIGSPGRPGSVGIPAEGRLFLYRLPYVFKACTLAALAVNIQTLGTAGAVVRIGAYLETDGAPAGAPLADVTVPGTGTGNQEAAAAAAVPANSVLWLAVVIQGAAVTRPSCYLMDYTAGPQDEAGYQLVFPAANAGNYFSGGFSLAMGYFIDGVAGALPTNPAISTANQFPGNNAPRVTIKVT